MKKIITLLLLALIPVFCLKAQQNIVLNPSFENFQNCPADTSDFDGNIDDWQVAFGTPDLFNVCGTDAGVPINILGEQTPASGDSYAGFYAFDENDYREYIVADISDNPMEEGKLYCIEVNISLAEAYAGGGIQNVGMFFSDEPLSGNLLNSEAQVVFQGQTLDRSDVWMEIRGAFQALDDLNYFAIGNFADNQNTQGNLNVPGTNDLLPAYYYIDDVSIFEIQPPLISVSPQSYCDNEVIFLTDSQTDNFSTYEWFTLDDPNTILSTSATFQTNAIEETYVVRKIVEGCALTDTIEITPNPVPEVFFMAENVCEGSVVQFIDASSNVDANSIYEWDIFNDGTIDFTTNGSIEFLFDPPVVTEVSLTVSNGNCSNQFVVNIDTTQPCDPCDNLSNLVPNGDMEIFESCPEDLNLEDPDNDFDYISIWNQATLGTPDFFNSCYIPSGGDSADIPDNEFGTQVPASGNSYVGFYAMRDDDKREYLTTELMEALLPDNQYCIEFSLSLADISSVGIENIGVHLSEDDISDFSIDTNFSYNPTLESSGGFVTNTETWSVIVGAFLPTDTVNYLTIGNFRDNANTNTTTNTHPDALPPSSNLSYYYLDNVSILELPQLLDVEEVEACADEQIIISASEDYCTYEWELDDGTVLGSGNTLETSFSEPGLYQVFLTAYLGNCSRVETFDVMIGTSPEAAFTFETNCLGEETLILNTSTNYSNETLFDWYVDGNFITSTTIAIPVFYEFTELGTYDIQLIVTDVESDCVDIFNDTITINEACDECQLENIVINGSFEDISQCPDDINQIELTFNWNALADGNPVGYYNLCATELDASVPDNQLGNQQAQDGFAYAGVTTFANNDFRSYVYSELGATMEEGERYCVTYYLNCADNSSTATANLGVYFSEGDPQNLNAFSVTPQIDSGDAPYFSTDSWVEITQIITADADYNYLTIGNFNDNTNSVTESNGGAFPLSYYYIDNISVVPVEITLPQNQSICLGQTVTLSALTNLCEPQWIEQSSGQIVSDNNIVTVQPNITTNYVFQAFTENCGLIEETVTVTILDAPDAGPDVTICQGGTTQLNVTGGNDGYSWSPVDGLDDPTIQNPIASPTVTTTYTVTVDLGSGDCPNTAEVTVFVDDVNATITASNNIICDGESVTATAAGGDSYLWIPSDGVSDINSNNVILSPDVTTTYTITVTNSTTGCSDITELTVTVDECDEGGPQWTDNGLPIVELFDTTEVNVPIIINFPVVEDPDLPEDSFTISATDPQNGTFDFNNIQGTYTPDNGFVGNDTITLTVCDVLEPVECSDLDLIITVFSENEPPEFPGIENLDQFVFITVDSIWNFCYNIIDPEGEDITLTIQEFPENGTAQNLVNTFCVQYDPQGFVGTEMLTIIACDEQDICTSVDVFIQVDDFPVAPVVLDTLFNAFENSTTNFCLDIFDANNNIDTIIVTQELANGSVIFDDDGCFTFTPDPGYSGEDQMEIEVCDLTDLCTEAIITIVTANTIAANDDTYFIEENIPTYFYPTNNDLPNSVDTLYIIQPPLIGTTEIVDTIDAASIIYYPPSDTTALDSLQYAICSQPFGCDTAWVYINIQNLLDANDDLVSTPMNNQIDINVLLNDSIPNDNDVVFTTVLTSDPENGVLIENSDGSYTYIPNDGFTGVDSFTYQICSDSTYGCTFGTVLITVSSASAPDPSIDEAFTEAGAPVEINVLENDSDPQDSPISVMTGSLGASNGTAYVNDNGWVVYTPDSGFTGTDTLFYNVVNEFGLFSQSFVVIEVGECTVKVQEALTPNGDNRNDEWVIPALLNCANFQNNTVTIYNRWGNKVFEARNYGTDGWWNGTWEKNNEPLPVGTYFYVITIDGQKRRDWQRGAIEIIR